MKKSFSLCTACLVLLTLLGGCGTPDLTSSAPVPAPEESTTTASTAAHQTTPPAGGINILTGNTDMQDDEATRPVAIMIGNDSPSRPQYGIEKADMYVEAETEGGITRLMVVFANALRVPEKLAPIRSARSPFVNLAKSLDAVYCHAGGSKAGLETVKTTDVTAMNALGNHGAAFWRDAALRQSKGLEYSLMTGGEKLAARIKALKYRSTTTGKSPFAFGAKAGSGAGEKLQITFSGNQTDSFLYDEKTALYAKYNGALGKNSPHKSANGTQITATNVIVMYDEKFAENNTTISFRLNAGNGLLASGGTSRPIKWKRTSSQLTYTETDGTPLNVAAGKSYICLVTTGNEGKTVTK